MAIDILNCTVLKLKEWIAHAFEITSRPVNKTSGSGVKSTGDQSCFSTKIPTITKEVNERYCLASKFVFNKYIIMKQFLETFPFADGAKNLLDRSLTSLKELVLFLKGASGPLAAQFKEFVMPVLKQLLSHPMIKPIVEWLLSLKDRPLLLVGILLVLLFVWRCRSGGGGGLSGGKKMKAPGKPGVMMLRSKFENNPKSYFEDLRT